MTDRELETFIVMLEDLGQDDLSIVVVPGQRRLRLRVGPVVRALLRPLLSDPPGELFQLTVVAGEVWSVMPYASAHDRLMRPPLASSVRPKASSRSAR